MARKLDLHRPLLLGVAALGSDLCQSEKVAPIAGGFAAADTDTKVIAYYFHVTVRCTTCRTIESYSREVIEQKFGADIAKGRLQYKLVNVQLPGEPTLRQGLPALHEVAGPGALRQGQAGGVQGAERYLGTGRGQTGYAGVRGARGSRLPQEALMILSATAVLTAVWLGILTSISPCPLATNVAAMSFIGKDLSSPRRVLLDGSSVHPRPESGLRGAGRPPDRQRLRHPGLVLLALHVYEQVPRASPDCGGDCPSGIGALQFRHVLCRATRPGSVSEDPDPGAPDCSGFCLRCLSARCPRPCSSAACCRSP